MFVPFETLPESSKVWIYQLSRLMSDEEAEQLFTEAKLFVDNWTAHQANLKASVTVLYNVFVIFAVDESHNDASGCSIDSKVHFIKSIEKKMGMDFFDRFKVAFACGKAGVSIVPLHDLNNFLSNKTISAHTLVFNNLISDLSEFRNSWKVPLKDSWVINFVEPNLISG